VGAARVAAARVPALPRVRKASVLGSHALETGPHVGIRAKSRKDVETVTAAASVGRGNEVLFERLSGLH